MAAKSSITAAAGKTTSSAGNSSNSSDTLSKAQIDALEAVSGGSFKKVLVKRKDKPDKIMYEVSIPATKKISAKSLEDAAKQALAAAPLLSEGDNQTKLQGKIQSAVEKSTIQRALKLLDGIVKPATEASLDI